MIKGATILVGVAGVLLIADGITTIVWQEPISALYASLQQSHLNGQLRSLERAPPTPAEVRVLAREPTAQQRMAYLAGRERAHLRNGAPAGTITIPRIGAHFIVVNGTDTGDLEKGPGLYHGVPFPAQPGTVGIAGHRTTFLAPFRHIDALRRGDHVVLTMPYGRFVYSVQYQQVVLPNDVSVLRPVSYPRVVLTACTPPFSASHRLVVSAKLISSTPLGAAVAGAVVHPVIGPSRQQVVPLSAPAPRVIVGTDSGGSSSLGSLPSSAALSTVAVGLVLGDATTPAGGPAATTATAAPATTTAAPGAKAAPPPAPPLVSAATPPVVFGELAVGSAPLSAAAPAAGDGTAPSSVTVVFGAALAARLGA